jgi:hypothetical protein
MPGFDSADGIVLRAPLGWSASVRAGVPCLLEGTRIATAAGPRLVERLAAGDAVVTLLDGPYAVVRSAGMREVDCRRHPVPEMVWPVRIAAHAFGPCEPMRTLLVSPGQAVWVDGVMVPVLALVNGRTILQVRMDRVRYYHVAFDRADAMVAEGLAVEAQRAPVGETRVVSLFPDFRSPCSVDVGEIQTRLAERAVILLGEVGAA